MSICVSCKDLLVVPIDQDDSEAGVDDETVPDDLQVPCGCHFHWQCFLDSAPEVAVSLKCPSCDTYLPANRAGPSTTNTIFHTSQEVAIMTRYHNEGGFQEDYNILPDVTEEAYLLSHPEARPARAFHTLCAEGDVSGILELLADAEAEPDEEDEEGEEGRLTADQLLRYQDPLAGMKGALHLVIEKDRAEVALLLLYLASGLPTESFPQDSVRAAQGYGLRRPTLAGLEHDVRALKDSQGRTAEEYAHHAGGRWTSFIEAGMFA